jgi:MFS family permease
MFSRVNSLLGFYVVFPVIILGGSFSGFLPVVTAVNNWFSRRRGLATGICSAGVNVGGVLVAVVALFIGAYGWRAAAVMIGLIIWLLGFPLAAMIRHRPQPYGYLPDGDDPEEHEVSSGDGTAHPSADSIESPDFTPMQALKTPAFWTISACHGLSVLIISMVTIHQIPLLVDAGMSFETAASVLAFMTGVAAVGRVVGGYLADKVGMKPTLLVCFFLMSAGVVVLASAQTVQQAIVYAVLYGLGYGARAPILIALRAEFFGPRNFATIMGLSQPVMVIGSFLGPIAAGFAYDVQGSYRMVFSVIAVINLNRGSTGVLHQETQHAPAQRGRAGGRLDPW